MTQSGRMFLKVAALAAASALAACGSSNGGQSRAEDNDSRGFSIFGGGGDRNESAASEQAGIGVNSFLWRASLDTLNFMPLASADPFGGVIITDWHSDAAAPNERFKATVYILDTRLRADALNVSIFRQQRDPSGQWVDAPVSAETGIQIENAILTRARQLRLSTLNE